MNFKIAALLLLVNFCVGSFVFAEGGETKQLKRQISRVADRISIDVTDSRLSQDELEDVLRQINRISNRLNGDLDPGPQFKEDRAALIEFAQAELAKDGYGASQSLEKARGLIKQGLSYDLFMYVYPILRKDGYGVEQSLNEAVTASGNKNISFKLETFKFIYEAFKKDGYSNKQAIDFGSSLTPKVPVNGQKTFENYVSTYKKDGYSNKQAIEKAIALLESDEKSR